MTTRSKSVRQRECREVVLMTQAKMLEQRITDLEAKVFDMEKMREHECKEYRSGRNALIDYFASGRGGPKCMACMDKRAVPMLPCTHQVVCITCALKLEQCPVCRTKIDDVVIRKSPAFRAPLYCLHSFI